MTVILNKIKSVTKWLGRSLLFIIGSFMATSEIYQRVIYNLNLTEKEPSETDWVFFAVGVVVVYGGVHLDKAIASISTLIPTKK